MLKIPYDCGKKFASASSLYFARNNTAIFRVQRKLKSQAAEKYITCIKIWTEKSARLTKQATFIINYIRILLDGSNYTLKYICI